MCKDELKSIFQKLKFNKKLIHFAIINLENEEDGNGTHWVCYFKCYSTIYYFDSFGVQPFQYLIDLCKSNNYLLWYNTKKYQEDNWSCGYWCLKVILDILDIKY